MDIPVAPGTKGNGKHTPLVYQDNRLSSPSQLEREKANLLEAVKLFGPKQIVVDEVDAIERRQCDLARRKSLTMKSANQPMRIPRSVAELRAGLEAQFQPLNIESPEFGHLLRQIVPEFRIYLVRLVDGGHLMPRARMKLAFGGIVADVARIPAFDDMLTRVLTIDLFKPSQRERIRVESIDLEAKGLEQRQIAQAIKENPSQAAVHNAIALHRQMHSSGLPSPHVIVREPLNDYPKMRRHRNRKYQFLPLEGYVPPEL